MGQVYSNKSGTFKAYAVPPVPGGPIAEGIAEGYAMGYRTPIDMLRFFAIRLMWALLFAAIFIPIYVIYRMKYHPSEPIFINAKEKFEEVEPFDPGLRK
jgi:hypothetical protein